MPGVGFGGGGGGRKGGWSEGGGSRSRGGSVEEGRRGVDTDLLSAVMIRFIIR